jgi:PAS domain S-box-containing protein
MDIGRDARSVKSLSRHTLERMVSLSSEGILLADAKDPRLPIVYANPAYEDLSGYSVEELTGNSWQLWKREGEGQPEHARLKAAIGRAEACAVTLPDVRKDGTSWMSRVSVEPLYNARGELQYFLCVQRRATDVVAEPTMADVSGELPPAVDAPVDTENVEVKLLQHVAPGRKSPR